MDLLVKGTNVSYSYFTYPDINSNNKNSPQSDQPSLSSDSSSNAETRKYFERVNAPKKYVTDATKLLNYLCVKKKNCTSSTQS